MSRRFVPLENRNLVRPAGWCDCGPLESGRVGACVALKPLADELA